MRSGNGRHRRPRQTPRIVVAAGVTGASVAIPFIGATSASATSNAAWDKIATCESGGSWSANSGNGYFGGLQITQNNWDAYGGKKYAPRPDLASRMEQISVAERLLAAQGPLVWASCAVDAGIGQDDTPAPSDTDTAATEDPVAPSPDGQGTDEPSAEVSPTATTTPSPDASPTGEPTADTTRDTERSQTPPSATTSPTADPSATDRVERPTGDQSLTTPGTTGGAPRHAAPRSPEGEPAAERPSRGGGKHRAPDRVQDQDQDRGQRPADYTVAPGDSLSAIAADHDSPGGWRDLYDANRDTIGDDPDLIIPGQRLLLPGGE
ncbi:hypothetical protein AQ490_23420 [Wenjunlia vitaminophila]|uniref:LysM domain-containing protein n=1 Tax=Wenjunlia vitaminophila TaxID=76728 RepID=A0A0T6LS66_WENVI|nr:hypothetical protein AQ490_23420 [Wenjunlia vitaminophila]